MTGSAGGRFSSWRLAARLARRETLRRPWRTLLVALLVAVPVAGMLVAAVWVRTDDQSARAQWRARWGNADLYAELGAPGGAPSKPGGPSLDALLPEHTRTVSYRSEYARVLRTADGNRSSAEVTDLPMADPMASPIVQVMSGRVPMRAEEVFLARSVARRLGVRVGDSVRLQLPQRLEWSVVGVGERRAWWGSDIVVLGPGTRFPWRDDRSSPAMRTVLGVLPGNVTAAQLTALSRSTDGVAFAPDLLAGRAPGAISGGASETGDAQALAWSWVIGALVLTVVGIVIAAAFAAGARRQLATLGQLAANGASPAALRRVLFLQGTWTGLLGAVLGLGLAAVTLAVAAPHVNDLFNRDVGHYAIRPSDLIPIVVLGITAATLAALVPARTTARIPVLAALAGRRPLRPVPTWLTVAGLALGAAGLALLGLAVLGGSQATSSGSVWMLTAIVGGVAVLLGACAVAPGYVSVLEPLACRLRGASRLAARSLARQRTRTGAVVSAVCATSALAIAASALVVSADAKDSRQPRWMRLDEVQLQATTQDRLVTDQRSGPTPRPTAVPDGLVNDVIAAVPHGEIHHVHAAGLPGTGPNAQWEIRDFVPNGPAPKGGLSSLGGGPFSQGVVIADEALFHLYDLPGAARRSLEKDGIVAVMSNPIAGRATVVLSGESSGTPSRATSLTIEDLTPPVALDVVGQKDLALGSVPHLLVTPSRARAMGLEPMAGPTVVRAPRPLTDAQRTAVQDAVAEYNDVGLDATKADTPLQSVSVDVLYPPNGPDPRLLEALLTAVAFLLSMFVVAVSLALAAAETRDERDVLVIVGAPPSTMRKTSGRKALLLTLLGTALAVPVGFLPVSVFTAASTKGLPLIFPWRVVLVLLVAVPVLAAGATTLFSGLALRLRPVHVSTMSFD